MDGKQIYDGNKEKKMNFSDFMNSLPNLKTEAINELAALTRSSKVSVYNWINGGTVPPLKQELIAAHLGRPVEELFPKAAAAGERKEGRDE